MVGQTSRYNNNFFDEGCNYYYNPEEDPGLPGIDRYLFKNLGQVEKKFNALQATLQTVFREATIVPSQRQVLAKDVPFKAFVDRNTTINLCMVKATLYPIDCGLGFYVFALETDNKIRFLFPGTKHKMQSLGAGATLVADLDPLGPGYLAAKLFVKPKIQAFIASNEIRGGKEIEFNGFSLGGAMAVHLHFDKDFKNVKTYTFGAPRTSYWTNRHWNQQKSEQLHHYCYKNDPIPELGGVFGDEHLGTVNVLTAEGVENLSSTEAHTKTYSGNEKRKVHQIKAFVVNTAKLVGACARVAVMTPLFVIAILALTLFRAVFGYHKNRYVCLLGPLRGIALGYHHLFTAKNKDTKANL